MKRFFTMLLTRRILIIVACFNVNGLSTSFSDCILQSQYTAYVKYYVPDECFFFLHVGYGRLLIVVLFAHGSTYKINSAERSCVCWYAGNMEILYSVTLICNFK